MINEDEWKCTEQERKMSNALQKVSKEIGLRASLPVAILLLRFTRAALADYLILLVVIAHVMQ